MCSVMRWAILKLWQWAQKEDGVPLFWTRSFYLLIIEVEVHYSTEISHSCTKTQKQLQLCARGSISHTMGGYYKHCDWFWILTLQHSSLARAKNTNTNTPSSTADDTELIACAMGTTCSQSMRCNHVHIAAMCLRKTTWRGSMWLVIVFGHSVLGLLMYQ